MMRAAQQRYRPDRDAEQTPEQFERTTLGLTLEPHGHNPTATRLVVTANLVATNAAAFKRLAADAFSSGVLDLVVDLAHCPYIDSTGLGALVSVANAAKRAGRRMAVVNANEDLRTLFSLTKLDQLFEVR